MTEQEKQKLNEKLAKFAGFTSKEPDKIWGRWILRGEPDPKTLIQPIIGSGNLNKSLNFTDSLDACDEWLVPKLRSVYLQSDESSNFACMVLVGDNRSPLTFDKNPALALCLAIEKLIDTQNEDTQE